MSLASDLEENYTIRNRRGTREAKGIRARKYTQDATVKTRSMVGSDKRSGS